MSPVSVKRSAADELGSVVKKLDSSVTETEDIRPSFNSKIFEEEFRRGLKQQIADSQPYRWGTIEALMNDDLLRSVRKEILSEIHFTKKETDIYKVYQSGDLANLSGLNWDDLSRLPSLYKLRSAIYSQEFRDFISFVTGCGKLSGVKTDMSVNTYTKGCHLLTHDDVIGSRRVSFILYLPEPNRVWKPHYGGSLRLFDSIVPNVPKPDYHCKLTPQFNQIAFFTVQPGLSFHDVEEVRVDKQRLSIQGWFHIPQKGEEGFIPGEQERTEAKSTLQQLESKELKEFDFPKVVRNDINEDEIKIYQDLDNLKLSELDTEYLSKFMNPSLLTEESITKLNDIFVEESVVDIHLFLNDEVAQLLQDVMKKFELNEYPKMPTTQAEVKFPWKQSIPPHKQKYLYIDGRNEEPIENSEEISYINNVAPQELPNFGLLSRYCQLQYELEKNPVEEDSGMKMTTKLCEISSFLRSISFKKWLCLITGLVLVKDQILVRRFRPGQDFILATQLDEQKDESLLDSILEATLNLTPSKGWDSGELGGYELCMLVDEDEKDNDLAIYKKIENDDSVLFTSQASWNKLSLMLRDPSVLKFIKYVSFNANGSRFDINCQWNCQNSETDD